MRRDDQPAVTAVLGPTNTGKTHLAVERMCGHSSGMIGFPLRLLAREVYDRVVAIKGAATVALITGEEKIVPPDARYFLCTAESMPLGGGISTGADHVRDVAFLALDEAQLGADPERGHVFTDRILRARGREETMLLGSEALRPMLKALVPGVEIVNRPRFSTLSYAGAKKISRLPKRSAIVAFSAEEVYAVAEMLRRLRGGAAVVMGALSPRTRNAQVAMFQSGEVDYLVATDAIGMGLNMDVAHVAFASLHKFDGVRQRRLRVAEMAQIAGRAGRHQRDGTFGALVEDGPGAFGPEEVLAIEEHRFPPLEHLYWREGAPDLSGLDALIESLELRPAHRCLRGAPQATDLAVLKRMADERWVRDRVRSPAMVARLWAACGLPDFRKLGADPHLRFVAKVFEYLSEGHGHVPHTWFAAELARLDTVSGDVETLAGRIAAARSWAYIANRADWLADPAHWAARAGAVEERLSDALHASLTQRFVDKRTTLLMRQVGADPRALPVTIGPQGEVLVEDHAIGRLDGFRFVVSPEARAADKRLLLAAAERRLGDTRGKLAATLLAAPDSALALALAPGERPTVRWDGIALATLGPGPTLVRPRVVLDKALDCLPREVQARIAARIAGWVEQRTAHVLPGLVRLDAVQRDAAAGAALRAVAAGMVAHGGLVPRAEVAQALDRLDPEARRQLRSAGVTLGALDLFDARLLKPRPAGWRRALVAARNGEPVAPPPREGATVLERGSPGATLAHGFRLVGVQAVRVDLVERIARAAHDARTASGAGRGAFVLDPALATSIGLTAQTLARLMAGFGFRPSPSEDAPRWVWRGLPVARPAAPSRDTALSGAFSALADLAVHG